MNSDNLILIFNTSLYLLAFIFIIKHRKFLSIASLIFFLYAIVSVVSFFLFNDANSYYYFKEVTFFPFIYLFVLLLIASYPILKLNEKEIQKLYLPSIQLVIAFTIFVIIVFFLSVFGIIGSFDQILANLIIDSSKAGDIYLQTRTAQGSPGINIIGVLAPALRDYPQFLLFYFLTFRKVNKLLIILLIIVVLISILSGLVNGLRGNVIFVLLSSVFCYLFFKGFYSSRVRKRIKIGILIGLVVISIPFIAISIGRFSTPTSSIDSGYALKTYTGQSFLYFNNYGLDANGIRDGERTMNLFKRMVYDNVPKGWEEVRHKHREMKMDDGVFSTFIGEFTLDFGPIVTFFLFVLFSIFMTIKTKIRETAYLHQTLLLYFIWNSITFGIFLFPYADINGNVRIIIFACLFILFKFSTSKNHFVLRNTR